MPGSHQGDMQPVCMLRVDRIFQVQLVFSQMQPACRLYYARVQSAYNGMQNIAGCRMLHACCMQPAAGRMRL